MQGECNKVYFDCRAAAYLMQKYKIPYLCFNYFGVQRYRICNGKANYQKAHLGPFAYMIKVGHSNLSNMPVHLSVLDL